MQKPHLTTCINPSTCIVDKLLGQITKHKEKVIDAHSQSLMIRHSLTIQNKLGMHTRSAAKLVDTAKRFQSKVELVFRDRAVDCKSIMGVITLGAQKDDVLDVVITGDDETGST